MKKLIIVILFFLAACGSSLPALPTDLSGTEGVVITPIDLDDQVYVNEEVVLIYEIENRGASDLSELNYGIIIPSYDKLYLEFTGYVAPRKFLEVSNLIKIEDDKTLFENGVLPFWLYGRDLYLPGEKTFITMSFRTKEIRRNTGIVRTPILFTTCYPYQSNVTASVCIEQTRLADQGSVVCRKAPVSPQTPAAPIGVSRVEVRTNREPSDADSTGLISPGKIVPTFRIHLQNYGRGIPSYGTCLDGNNNLNTAVVRAYLLDQELDCSLDGEVNFVRGEAKVLCSARDTNLELSAGSANYITLLSVNIEYSYRESDKIDLEIFNE